MKNKEKFKVEKQVVDQNEISEMSKKFYVEELEERFEMAEVPNQICAGWRIRF